MEDEQPETGRHRGRHRVRPHEECPVRSDPPDLHVGHHREEEREAHGERRHGKGKDNRDLDGAEVQGVGEDRAEILEPDKFGPEAERILDEHRPVDGLHGRPEEEDHRDGELWGKQQVRKNLVWKDDAPAHQWPPRSKIKIGRDSRSSRLRYWRLVRSKFRRMVLPRCTVLSSACLAVCWPWKAFSISSCMTTRISGILPSRSPRELAVGSVSVS